MEEQEREGEEQHKRKDQGKEVEEQHKLEDQGKEGEEQHQRSKSVTARSVLTSEN